MSKVADFRAMIERDYDREILMQLLEDALIEEFERGREIGFVEGKVEALTEDVWECVGFADWEDRIHARIKYLKQGKLT